MIFNRSLVARAGLTKCVYMLCAAGTSVGRKYLIFSDNECHTVSCDLPKHPILQLDRAVYTQMTKQLNSSET